MCVAIPGKILEINENIAKVDFKGNVVNVNMGLVEGRPGQYVLVHAGCAIQVMEEDEAMEVSKLFEELEEAMQ